MNYRHQFHAGNFADVHKHLVLVALLDHLLQKPTPILYLDTHAGRGDYDFQNPKIAAIEPEWHNGIRRLWGHTFKTPLLQRYVQLIQDYQPLAAQHALWRYPGSPALAARLLRAHDRRVFVEQHAEEARALHALLHSARYTSVLHDDGYQTLRAQLPPKEKRCLVLLDPPYEAANEYQQLQQALQLATQRWPNGMYCAWYPIKADAAFKTLHSGLVAAGLRKILLSEIWLQPRSAPVGLNGSGLLLINPPWQLELTLRPALQELLLQLAPTGTGGMQLQWLVAE